MKKTFWDFTPSILYITVYIYSWGKFELQYLSDINNKMTFGYYGFFESFAICKNMWYDTTEKIRCSKKYQFPVSWKWYLTGYSFLHSRF